MCPLPFGLRADTDFFGHCQCPWPPMAHVHGQQKWHRRVALDVYKRKSRRPARGRMWNARFFDFPAVFPATETKISRARNARRERTAAFPTVCVAGYTLAPFFPGHGQGQWSPMPIVDIVNGQRKTHQRGAPEVLNAFVCGLSPESRAMQRFFDFPAVFPATVWVQKTQKKILQTLEDQQKYVRK